MEARAIMLGWDISEDPPGLRRLTAECEDEFTEMVFAGPEVFNEADPQLLAGPAGQMAVEYHHAHCTSCQQWQKANPGAIFRAMVEHDTHVH